MFLYIDVDISDKTDKAWRKIYVIHYIDDLLNILLLRNILFPVPYIMKVILKIVYKRFDLIVSYVLAKGVDQFEFRGNGKNGKNFTLESLNLLMSIIFTKK